MTRITLAIVSILLVGCVSKKSSQLPIPENIPNQSIFLGEGGGFTGEFIGYEIFNNGKVVQWQTSARGEMDSATIAKKDYFTTDSYFIRLANLEFTEMKLRDPGNYYYRLELKRPDSVHAVTWGGTNQEVPQKLVVFYNDLKAFVKAKK